MTIDVVLVRQRAQAYAEAWSSRSPGAVASFYAEDGTITINRGETSRGRDAVAAMAAGFYAEFPDLIVRCDDVRLSGDHAVFVWTLEGRHSATGRLVTLGGWEEWELDAELQIRSSLGWFDAADYDRQVGHASSPAGAAPV